MDYDWEEYKPLNEAYDYIDKLCKDYEYTDSDRENDSDEEGDPRKRLKFKKAISVAINIFSAWDDEFEGIQDSPRDRKKRWKEEAKEIKKYYAKNGCVLKKPSPAQDDTEIYVMRRENLARRSIPLFDYYEDIHLEQMPYNSPLSLYRHGIRTIGGESTTLEDHKYFAKCQWQKSLAQRTTQKTNKAKKRHRGKGKSKRTDANKTAHLILADISAEHDEPCDVASLGRSLECSGKTSEEETSADQLDLKKNSSTDVFPSVHDMIPVQGGKKRRQHRKRVNGKDKNKNCLVLEIKSTEHDEPCDVASLGRSLECSGKTSEEETSADQLDLKKNSSTDIFPSVCDMIPVLARIASVRK
jgi:hypothetical protein